MYRGINGEKNLSAQTDKREMFLQWREIARTGEHLFKSWPPDRQLMQFLNLCGLCRKNRVARNN